MKDLTHRDDVPFDVVEELERALGSKFPGAKVCFAGDLPDGSGVKELMREILEAWQERVMRSFVDGRCLDCGARVPGRWPPEEGDPRPEGWAIY